MICELHNKMCDVMEYTFDGKIDGYMHVKEVSLYAFIYMLVLCIVILMLFTWWLIPLRIIFSPPNKITFKCKRKDL